MPREVLLLLLLPRFRRGSRQPPTAQAGATAGAAGASLLFVQLHLLETLARALQQLQALRELLLPPLLRFELQLPPVVLRLKPSLLLRLPLKQLQPLPLLLVPRRLQRGRVMCCCLWCRYCGLRRQRWFQALDCSDRAGNPANSCPQP